MGLFNKNKVRNIKLEGIIDRIGICWGGGDGSITYACKFQNSQDYFQFAVPTGKLSAMVALSRENDKVEIVLKETNPKYIPEIIEFKNFSM